MRSPRIKNILREKAYRDLKPRGFRLVFFLTERLGLKLSGLIAFPFLSSNVDDVFIEKSALLDFVVIVELISEGFGVLVA